MHYMPSFIIAETVSELFCGKAHAVHTLWLAAGLCLCYLVEKDTPWRFVLIDCLEVLLLCVVAFRIAYVRSNSERRTPVLS